MKSSMNSMFMRRVKGLKKKTSELGTLCGIDALLICYRESGDEQDIPQTWPENPGEVRRIIKSYKDHLQQENNGRKRRRQPLAEDTLTEKRRKIADKDILSGYSSDQLQKLLKVVDSKLEKVNHLLAEKRDQELHPCTEQICDQRSVSDSQTELRIDLAPPMPMPSDSMRFAPDPFLPKLQQEKQDQCGLSSGELESMMIFLEGLENEHCYSTMLGHSVPFPRMNGMGLSIPLHCSFDSMGFFGDPSLPNMPSDSMRFVHDPFHPESQQGKQDQCGLSSSEIESMRIFLEGLENEHGHCIMLGHSVPFPWMNGMSPAIPLHCSYDSMNFFEYPSLPNLQ